MLPARSFQFSLSTLFVTTASVGLIITWWQTLPKGVESDAEYTGVLAMLAVLGLILVVLGRWTPHRYVVLLACIIWAGVGVAIIASMVLDSR